MLLVYTPVGNRPATLRMNATHMPVVDTFYDEWACVLSRRGYAPGILTKLLFVDTARIDEKCHLRMSLYDDMRP